MSSKATASCEKAMFLAHLSAQRRHVLGILDGLSDDQLRRPVLPTGWTCLGLVQHLALDVERFWFRAVMVGEDGVIDSGSDDGNAWQVAADIPSRAIFDLYQQEIERSNAAIADLSLDAPPAWWPDFFASFRFDTLRDVILHVVTETACHAGHADAVREILDGRTWMVLD